jgi:hypothetical protein
METTKLIFQLQHRSVPGNCVLCDNCRIAAGAAIAELLTGLFLANLVFLLVLSSARAAFSSYQAISAKQEQVDKTNKLRQVLSIPLDASRARYALTTVRTHPNGMILGLDGTPHPIHRRTGETTPKNGSDAISFLELEQNLAFRVLNAGSPGSSRQQSFVLCGASKSAVNVNQLNYWLAVGIDGYIETQGSMRRIADRLNECRGGRKFRGTFSLVSHPMFGKRRSSKTNGPAAVDFSEEERLTLLARSISLLPVKECYTIYIDLKMRLRRLAHNTQENQPIAYGFDTLKFAPGVLSGAGEMIVVSVVLTASPGRHRETYEFRLVYPGENSGSLLDLLI